MTEAAAARDGSAVHAERRGAAGFIVLDRPRALNALTLPMVGAIAAALDDFEPDPRVARVVIASAGGRAFCSGGDIRLFYEDANGELAPTKKGVTVTPELWDEFRTGIAAAEQILQDKNLWHPADQAKPSE